MSTVATTALAAEDIAIEASRLSFCPHFLVKDYRKPVSICMGPTQITPSFLQPYPPPGAQQNTPKPVNFRVLLPARSLCSGLQRLHPLFLRASFITLADSSWLAEQRIASC